MAWLGCHSDGCAFRMPYTVLYFTVAGRLFDVRASTYLVDICFPTTPLRVPYATAAPFVKVLSLHTATLVVGVNRLRLRVVWRVRRRVLPDALFCFGLAYAGA
jgi:hypothetical protein